MTGSLPAFERLAAGGPASLVSRARAYLPPGPADRSEAERLAAASRSALARAVAGPADRSVAGDLLAADALVTLALLACAEASPARLAEFARTLRRQGVGA
jgi:hypothetical protein